MFHFIMCSRGDLSKDNNLEMFFSSILESTQDKSAVSFHLKLDDDDPQLNKLCSVIDHASNDLKIRTLVSPRGEGYLDMHKTYNQLFVAAPIEKKLFSVVSDDTRFNVHGWDQILMEAYSRGSEHSQGSNLFVIHQEDRFSYLDCTPENICDHNEPWPFWTREWIEALGCVGMNVATDAQTALIEHALIERYGYDPRIIVDHLIVDRILTENDQVGTNRIDMVRPRVIAELLSLPFQHYVKQSADKIALLKNYNSQSNLTILF